MRLSPDLVAVLQLPNLYDIDRAMRAGSILFGAEQRKMQHHGWDTSMPVSGWSRLGPC